MEPASGESLRQGVGLTGVVMFGAGTAIGVSIFSVLQPAAQVAGSGLLAAIAIAAVPMLLFAMVYAWLASALPVSGASYEWPRRFLGPFVGFAIAWLRILGNVGALVVLARVLSNYLGMAVALPATPVMAAAITCVFALNYVGVTVAARVQTLLMAVLIAVLALFVGAGAPLLSGARIGSPLEAGPAALMAAVPLMISLFLGIESAVEIGEEVRNPTRTIPLGILLAILLTASIYAAVAITALGLIGPAALAASKAPLLDAARLPLGAWALPVIVGAATVSILKTMNSTALVFSRSIFAMGRAGAFPAGLAAVHPRFGTPHRAILLCYGFAMLGLLLPPSLVFLLLAVNIPTMLKYLACSLCAVRLASVPSELRDRAALRFPPRLVAITGWAAALAAVLIIAAGVEADWKPYLLVAGWFVVGLVYYRVRGRRAAPSGQGE
ncbi:MAG: amino acid permease-associated protein [Alphaproteobacteria bacterium]|nr:amino acid permease-associated protein [Alphaproteobacteria bacterium]